MIRPPHVVGRRGAVLAYLAVVDVLFAVSLADPAPPGDRPSGVRFLAEVLPLQVWAGLWAAVAVVLVVGAFVHRIDRWAFAAAIMIKTLWGHVYLLGWIVGEVERGWVNAVVWLGLAVLVMIIAGWPEPRSETPGVDVDGGA